MNTQQETPAYLGQFIPLQYHTNMLRDAARMKGFKEALERVVPQGGKVLELGGGTGVLSFFAAKNASKVWCVERNPELVEAAKRFTAMNPFAEKIEIIAGDAMDYLPPEPVDVVICEMLHVGMLREKQLEVIQSFKARYQKKFGPKCPLFVPEAALLAVQPVNQNFTFLGYQVPTPMFYDPMVSHEETQSLSDPVNYQMFMYQDQLPLELSWNGTMTMTASGTLNALRFITKNLLAILPNENRAIEWFNQYLVVPIAQPLVLQKGDKVGVRFAYAAGASIETLERSLQVTRV
jgi:type I protein arginine methyltransferase